MISEYDSQTLFSLKNNTDFQNFLGAMSMPVDEFEKALKLVISSSFEEATTYSSFLFEAAKYQKLLSSCSSKDTVYFTNNKESRKSEMITEYSSQTDFSLCNSSRKDEQIHFRVIKKGKPNKLKFSLRKDCIRKKVKSMFHKYVISKLNDILHLSSQSISFKPLPKILSINLNLKENQQWTETSLRVLMSSEIFSKTGLDTANRIHNIAVLRKVNSEELDAFLNTKWKIAFEEFLLSPALTEAISEMEKTNQTYASKFRKHSSSLLKFLEH